MRVLILCIIAQALSQLGSKLSGFVVGVELIRQTQGVTAYAMIAFFAFLPGIILSPLAGVCADRFDRKKLVIFGDLGAACSTLLLLALIAITGHLETWHVYLTTTLSASFSTFQAVAFRAGVMGKIPPDQVTRINGVMEMGWGVSELGAPLVAVALMPLLSLSQIIGLDFCLFLLGAMPIFFFLKFEGQTKEEEHQERGPKRAIKDAWEAIGFLLQRPGLFGMLLFAFVASFTIGLVEVLLPPLVLLMSTPTDLALVNTLGGIGLVAGGALATYWSHIQRKVVPMVVCHLIQGMLFVWVAVHTTLPTLMWVVTVWLALNSFGMSYEGSIWSSKISLQMQGRMISLRKWVSSLAMAMAFALSGPIVDQFLTPAMMPNGSLSSSLGVILGVGESRGSAALTFIIGLGMIGTASLFWLVPYTRQLDSKLPDLLHESEDSTSLV